MAKVNALTFQITGLPNESGLFTMHLRNSGSTVLSPADAGTALTAFRTLIAAMAALIPSNVTWVPQGQGKAYDVNTAAITDVYGATGVPANVTGSGSSSSAAGAGLRVGRLTNTIRGRRFIRGCWFLVPLAQAAYGVGGEVSSSTKSTLDTAIAAFASTYASAGLVEVVYSRPQPAGASNGVMADIIGHNYGKANGLLHKRS